MLNVLTRNQKLKGLGIDQEEPDDDSCGLQFQKIQINKRQEIQEIMSRAQMIVIPTYEKVQ